MAKIKAGAKANPGYISVGRSMFHFLTLKEEFPLNEEALSEKDKEQLEIYIKDHKLARCGTKGTEVKKPVVEVPVTSDDLVDFAPVKKTNKK